MMKMLFVCFSISNRLLLTNGGMSTGNTMSDKHYLYVMDQIGQDRQNMKIMEQLVAQLHQEMNSTKQENGYLQHLEISRLRNESVTLKQTVAKLPKGYNALNENNKQLSMRLQSEIAACNGKTLRISDDLDKFKHSIVDQLKNSSELNDHVNSLNQKTDAINVMLNFLKSTPNAHGQDFHALLNKTAERRIDVLSDSQTNTSKWLDEAFHRISHINQTGIECSFI